MKNFKKKIERFFHGKYMDRIEGQDIVINALHGKVHELNNEVIYLKDLRRELSVIARRTEHGKMEINVAFTSATPISIDRSAPSIHDSFPYETIYLERCVGYTRMHSRKQLHDASRHLQELVADYCGEFLTKKIMKDLDA